MMVRIDLRRQELLRRILQTRKNSSVQIHKDNDLKLTALGYTVSTKGLLTVPEGVVLRHLPACLAHTPPPRLPCAYATSPLALHIRHLSACLAQALRSRFLVLSQPALLRPTPHPRGYQSSQTTCAGHACALALATPGTFSRIRDCDAFDAPRRCASTAPARTPCPHCADASCFVCAQMQRMLGRETAESGASAARPPPAGHCRP